MPHIQNVLEQRHYCCCLTDHFPQLSIILVLLLETQSLGFSPDALPEVVEAPHICEVADVSWLDQCQFKVCHDVLRIEIQVNILRGFFWQCSSACMHRKLKQEWLPSCSGQWLREACFGFMKPNCTMNSKCTFPAPLTTTIHWHPSEHPWMSPYKCTSKLQ